MTQTDRRLASLLSSLSDQLSIAERREVEEFIEVHEYGVALETLSALLIEEDKRIAPAIYAEIVDLADAMGLQPSTFADALRPLVLISARTARAVAEEGLKGLSVEVAHLTEGTLSAAPRFTWGDAVRIKRSAPVEMRAGECGVVVSITELDTQDKAGVYHCPVGSTVYQVEFGDGRDIKLEGTWLEADEA